jgi:Ca2+-binding RTX toxin-like protein
MAGLAALVAALVIGSPAGATSGVFERTWGKNVDMGGVPGFEVCTVAASCQVGATGGFGGELYAPSDLAADATGNVYVADQYNYRIQKFDSSGGFLAAWGNDVITGGAGGFEICTAVASCQSGSPGGLGGEFDRPGDVATDGAGNVYVVDSFSFRIQKFSSSGTFLRAWGKGVAGGAGAEICTSAASCQAGTAGTLGGEFGFPGRVAVDPTGNVYVIENSRIQKFTSAGAFQRAWGKDVDTAAGAGFEICINAANCKLGTPGTLGGELGFPDDVGADPAGNIYASDYSNHRVQKYDSSGNFLRTWGRNVDMGGVPGFEVCTVAASCQAGAVGGLGGELNGPRGISSDGAGNIYVAEDNDRLQRFDSSGSFLRAWGKGVAGGAGFEVCTVAASCQAGAPGGSGGELDAPLGIGADAAGNLYVADTGNQRIQKFAADPGPPPPDGTTLCGGKAATRVGTAGRNVIRGTGGKDVIAGLGGNDTLRGLGGNDIICGGAGNDKLLGGAGRDRLLGQAGRDTLRGGPGRDVLRGGPGRETQVQ